MANIFSSITEDTSEGQQLRFLTSTTFLLEIAEEWLPMTFFLTFFWIPPGCRTGQTSSFRHPSTTPQIPLSQLSVPLLQVELHVVLCTPVVMFSCWMSLSLPLIYQHQLHNVHGWKGG
jgi:hypothetical protein